MNSEINIIKQFFKEHNVQIENTFIDEDITKQNPAVLKPLDYALKHLNIPGVSSLLKDLASYKKDRDEQAKNINRQCQYHNDLTTLEAARLLTEKQDFVLTAAESKHNKIFSPYLLNPKTKRRENPSCDFRGILNKKECYLEIKNSDREAKQWGEDYFQVLGSPQGFANFLRDALSAAAKKGADYLVIRHPLWDGYCGKRDGLKTAWVQERLELIDCCEEKGFIIKPPISSIPSCLKGIFLIKPAYDLVVKFSFVN